MPIYGAPVSVSDVKTVLLEKLSGYQRKADGLYLVSDGILRVGQHTVDLTPVVESEGSAQGKSIVAMRIEVSVDGSRRPEATFGAIGISSTQDEAVAVGFGEWYLSFGLPFFQTLQEKESALVIADYDVFSGALGLRGGAALSWVDGSDAMNRKILDALTQMIPRKSDFVLFDLKVMVPPAGQPKSECRMNGVISAEVTSRFVALDWPRATDSYMVKQVFILKRKKPNQALLPTTTAVTPAATHPARQP